MARRAAQFAKFRLTQLNLIPLVDTFVSIVLMTDGENTDGATAKDFADYYTAQGADTRSIATYVVLFGNGNVDELTSVAKLTGGQAFDALNGDLSSAFQDIRGYQ